MMHTPAHKPANPVMMGQFSVWPAVYPGERPRLMLALLEHGWDYYYGFFRTVKTLD